MTITWKGVKILSLNADGLKRERRKVMNKVLSLLFVVIVLIAAFTLNACSVDTPTDSTTTMVTTTQTPDGPHIHEYGDWKVVESPTCNSNGLEERVCECGQKQTNAVATIDCVAGEWMVDEEATCTKEGTSSRYCIFCGEKMDTTITFSEGHIINITVISELSCTKNGLVRHECTREGCDYSYDIEIKAEHSVELKEKLEATCTDDGYIKYGCTKCDFEEITVIYGGHNYVSEITKKSTGDEKGEMTYTCSHCKDGYVEEIPMLKPGLYVLLIEDTTPWRTNTNVELLNALVNAGYIASWEKIASSQIGNTDLLKYGMILIANEQADATYQNLVNNKDKFYSFANDGGVLIYGACDQGWKSGNIGSAFLGEIKKGNYYSYRNYIVNVEHPIVTGALTDGISLTNELLYHNYTSHTYFMSLPQGANIILQDANGNPTLVEYEVGSGHVIVSGLTWEHNAKYEYNPNGSYANTVYDDLIIYATTLANTCQHKYDDGVKKEATCTESGYTLYTCIVCEFSYKKDISQSLGHTVDEWTQTLAPTCGTRGEEIGVCTICGNTAIRSVDKLQEHTEGEWVIDKEPTTTEAGLKCIKCTVCGEILSFEVLPKYSAGLEFTINSDKKSYSVTGIGECTDTDIVIPAIYNGLPVTRIGAYAFENCTSFTSIEVPNSVTSISHQAFSGCVSLKDVNYTGNIEDWIKISFSNYSNPMCNGANLYCKGELVTNLVIPDFVTSIGKFAFVGCISLESITFGENSQLTSIGDYVFKDCPSLTSIEIPDSLTNIGHSSFIGCISLESITFGDNSQLTSIGDYAFRNCLSLVSIEIPDSVTNIGHSSFNGCTSLESIIFGENSQLTSIGASAFYDCTSLKSITFSENAQLTSISYQAFYNCTSLRNVELSDYVMSIYGKAFYNCISLTSIEIPNSVTSIMESAFYNCTSLESITFEENSQLMSIELSAFLNCTTLTSIEIPSSVTSIAGQVFWNCSSLERITFAENSQLTNIGYSAFIYCTSLTSITIPDSVTSIGEAAFRNCSSLTIYCKATSKPSGWNSNWNSSNRPVVWGYIGE